MSTNETDLDSVVASCTNCGTQNRIPRKRLTDDPTCGQCKQKVFPRAPVTVTDGTYREQVEQSPLPVLIDFWAPWCAPCTIMGPVLDEIARERAGRLKIVKINVDENPTSASRFGVQAIPTMVLLRGPLHLDQMQGAIPKPALDARLDRFI